MVNRPKGLSTACRNADRFGQGQEGTDIELLRPLLPVEPGGGQHAVDARLVEGSETGGRGFLLGRGGRAQSTWERRYLRRWMNRPRTKS